MFSSLLPITTTLTAFPSTNTQPAFNTRTNQTQRFIVSCNNSPDNHHNDNKPIFSEPQNVVQPNVDRRVVLVGLGGLYTTANLPTTIAAPVKTPDITPVCKRVSSGFPKDKADLAIRPKDCCPPIPSMEKTEKPFVFPSESTVRMRWPAHKGTKDQVDKYREALQKMRSLPENHPHSFNSQAKIHCAYCHGGYNQVGENMELQVHNSWLFFPFHRWYVYFYERILGKLINDPTFALPYWKWDDPAGMQIPKIFQHEKINGLTNPLYDVYRESRHQAQATMDLNWDGKEKNRPKDQQIACNLGTLYRELVRNGSDTLTFFGGRYVAGDEPVKNGDKSVGSIEAGSHTAVHRWVGDSKQALNEDMGLFYSAGYDPLFYRHHANVDRIWKLWNDLSPANVEPNDRDWLDASYVFYDENEELVRVYNRDSVCLKNLKYNYIEETEEVFPWRKSRPAKRSVSSQVASFGNVETVEQIKFPVSLENKMLKVRVRRPVVNRTKEEKAKANEILEISKIQFDCNKFVKFDVFVNDKLKDGTVTSPCDPEYAGCFAQIPHSDVNRMSMSSAVRFGLSELLEDTNCEGDEYAIVTLVPRVGCEDLTIGQITIKLVPLFT